MRLEGEERREFQRLRVEPPIAGTLGETAVEIVEIGVLGARVTHAAAIGEPYGELHFYASGSTLTLKIEIVRSRGAAPKFESALRFLAAVDESGDRLRTLLAQLVTRELEARRNTPQPLPAEAAVDGDRTVRGKDARFLCYRFENRHWHKTRAFLPEQPRSGFTVASWVDPGEVSRLCRVFEAADEEGRRLIRLFAELSISGELEIPPRM
jgi:hypothetical protein